MGASGGLWKPFWDPSGTFLGASKLFLDAAESYKNFMGIFCEPM